MKSNRKYATIALMIVVLAACSVAAWSAEVISESTARSISTTVGPFIVVGELSLLSDRHEFTQGAKALVATTLATELMKYAVGDKRPNSDSKTSFPSGHTSAAFAMATVLADYKPKYKWPAYTLASAIGFSRVEAGSHYWDDVIAGALLGHFVAKHFSNDHVVVSPQGVGLQWKW